MPAVPFLNAFVVYIWFSLVMPIAFVMMARILELGACRVHRLFHKRHFIGFFFHRHIAGNPAKIPDFARLL